MLLGVKKKKKAPHLKKEKKTTKHTPQPQQKATLSFASKLPKKKNKIENKTCNDSFKLLPSLFVLSRQAQPCYV